MKDAWKIVPLEKVLRYRKEFIHISDLEKYKRCRVQCHVQGIVLRDLVEGTQIRTKNQQICKEGDFLVAEIDAKLGGFGIVPEELEGAIVSSHYYLYEIDEDLLDRSFFSFFIRTPYFRDQVSSQGSTNYAAIRYYDVLGYTMPLPPIAEQRRIVARIEELAAKIEEARGLRESAIEKATLLTKASLDDIFSKSLDSPEWSLINLNSVTEIARGKFTHRPRNDPRFYGGEIPFIQIGDISGSNRYIQNHTQTLNDEGLKVSRLFPIGTVVIAITGATVGATGILTFELAFPDSIVGIIPQEELVIPEFIYWSLEFFKQIALDEAKQTTQPNINLKILNKLKIPLPSIEVQKEIVSYLDDVRLKVDQITQLRENALKEFDALLPAILDKAFKGEL